MGLRHVYTGHFKHHYGGSFTCYILIYGFVYENGVTPRPDRVYGTCNRKGAYVNQKTFLII